MRVILEKPVALSDQGIQKGLLSWVCSNARPPGCCHSAAVPHMEVPDFLLHGASCGSSSVAASPAPPSSGPRHRGKPKIRRGICSEGKIQNASRPAQASENFRNCKRGHELKALELARREEGVKRKRVLLRAPTFSKPSLREFFLRLRDSKRVLGNL